MSHFLQGKVKVIVIEGAEFKFHVIVCVSFVDMTRPVMVAYRGLTDLRDGVKCPDKETNGQFDHPKYCDKYRKTFFTVQNFK